MGALFGDVETLNGNVGGPNGDVNALCGDVNGAFGDGGGPFGDVKTLFGDVNARCGRVGPPFGAVGVLMDSFATAARFAGSAAKFTLRVYSGHKLGIGCGHS